MHIYTYIYTATIQLALHLLQRALRVSRCFSRMHTTLFKFPGFMKTHMRYLAVKHIKITRLFCRIPSLL